LVSQGRQRPLRWQRATAAPRDPGRFGGSCLPRLTVHLEREGSSFFEGEPRAARLCDTRLASTGGTRPCTFRSWP